MTDRDRVLARVVGGPPGPRDPSLAETWSALDLDVRQSLARAAVDPAHAPRVAPHHRHLVVALARDRAERQRTGLLTPLGVGLLVLSTLWGFGRAADPTRAEWWLLAGLIGLAITAASLWRRGVQRRRRAHEVIRVLHDDG